MRSLLLQGLLTRSLRVLRSQLRGASGGRVATVIASRATGSAARLAAAKPVIVGSSLSPRVLPSISNTAMGGSLIFARHSAQLLPPDSLMCVFPGQDMRSPLLQGSLTRSIRVSRRQLHGASGTRVATAAVIEAAGSAVLPAVARPVIVGSSRSPRVLSGISNTAVSGPVS
ncbi:uncharacterized protein SCHCODRAFT_02257444 [Schizophyllum commune H4-8]|uniref:uncharacterized protein n=1 Tax=Schizophyllum commune (strain H4-8 / FGSC 9210) TaxID=578458 RepID=UPI0021601094|nr:uncharacterized protein SCHCODRAFT_02257444 [Schizophyllum commune H4-8]KAI5893621.1 hypothetical protein SCHCODRAFT_02257444 [Schizophyllum commune H4-8]